LRTLCFAARSPLYQLWIPQIVPQSGASLHTHQK
jgi:hypothetical protein